MVSTLIFAMLGGVAASAATAVATGDASALAHTVPPGLHVALSHVPSTSEAYEVLKQHLSLYAGTGSVGAAAGAIGHGLKLGLGK
jgi:hypothetical protein